MTQELTHDTNNDVGNVINAARMVEWAMIQELALDGPNGLNARLGRIHASWDDLATPRDIMMEPAVEEGDPDYDLVISTDIGFEEIEDEDAALEVLANAINRSVESGRNPYAKTVAVRVVKSETSIYPDGVLLVKANPRDPRQSVRYSEGEERHRQDLIEGAARDANGDPC